MQKGTLGRSGVSLGDWAKQCHADLRQLVLQEPTGLICLGCGFIFGASFCYI